MLRTNWTNLDHPSRGRVADISVLECIGSNGGCINTRYIPSTLKKLCRFLSVFIFSTNINLHTTFHLRMNYRMLHLQNRMKRKSGWLGHTAKAKNRRRLCSPIPNLPLTPFSTVGLAAITSIILGCDNNFTVLQNHEQFVSHIKQDPPLEVCIHHTHCIY